MFRAFSSLTILIIFCIIRAYPQQKGIVFSLVHNGVGNNISLDYQYNKSRTSLFLGFKYHINKPPVDNGLMLGDARAFNLLGHFGVNFGLSYKIWDVNDKIQLNTFYHSQYSYLGLDNMGYVPLGSFYDTLSNNYVDIYSRLHDLVRPGLIIEQNIGLEVKITLTEKIKLSEWIGSGIMIYFNEDEVNLNHPGAPNWEFIVPLFRIGIEYVL